MTRMPKVLKSRYKTSYKRPHRSVQRGAHFTTQAQVAGHDFYTHKTALFFAEGASRADDPGDVCPFAKDLSVFTLSFSQLVAPIPGAMCLLFAFLVLRVLLARSAS